MAQHFHRAGGPSDFHQINPQNSTHNQGALPYAAHKNRFNQFFCDTHVETLPVEETVGSRTTATPRGMWTIATGD